MRSLIKRRLVGKDGAERVRELRGILSELPNYKNGPYADIRKWVVGEIDATRSPARVVKIVSLEELAQMVRRRTPGPKPVPEGQLALFGT